MFKFSVMIALAYMWAADPANDAVRTRLDRAKIEYDKAVEKARSSLLGDLKKRTDAAKKAGDLKALEKALEEFQAFEKDGKAPRQLGGGTYEKQMKAARDKLEDSYRAAVKQYTKNDEIQQAKIIQQELEEFLKSDWNKVAASNVKGESRLTADRQLKIESLDGYYLDSGKPRKNLAAFKIKTVDGIVYSATVFGKKNAICTHPLAKDKPATIDFERVTNGRRGTLSLYTASNPIDAADVGGRIVVKTGGKIVDSFDVKKDAKWTIVKIAFNDEPVVVEHHAVGWSHEGMFFDYEIEWIR
jgi:hypothetical protein